MAFWSLGPRLLTTVHSPPPSPSGRSALLPPPLLLPLPARISPPLLLPLPVAFSPPLLLPLPDRISPPLLLPLPAAFSSPLLLPLPAAFSPPLLLPLPGSGSAPAARRFFHRPFVSCVSLSAAPGNARGACDVPAPTCPPTSKLEKRLRSSAPPSSS